MSARMRLASMFVASALMLAAGPAGAQEAARPNQLTLDASVLGANVTWARRTGPSDLLGVMLGAAGLWAASEHFGGDHFDDGDLLGLGHGGGFWRHEAGEHFEIDVGIQIGAVLHGGEEGNAAMALMGGPYVQPMVGWRNFKVGPRLIGAYVWEGSDTDAIGLVVDPLTARVQLRF